jgi:hypothetical protein
MDKVLSLAAHFAPNTVLRLERAQQRSYETARTSHPSWCGTKTTPIHAVGQPLPAKVPTPRVAIGADVLVRRLDQRKLAP